MEQQVSKFHIKITFQEELPIVHTKGECDLMTSRKLRDTINELLDTRQCKIIFDLGELTYIDSSGFRVLLEAKQKTTNKGGDIILVNLATPADRVFNLLGLYNLIVRADTIEDAIELLREKYCK